MKPGHGFWPNRHDYDKLTQRSPEEFIKADEDRRKKIAEKVKTWTDQEHLLVLREVFWAHQGAGEINVDYNPPGMDYGMVTDLIKALVDYGGWKATQWREGLIVGHCPESPHTPHLKVKTYQRVFKESNTLTRIDFPILHETMTDHLILIGDYIEVRLRHLYIPAEQIGRWTPPAESGGRP